MSISLDTYILILKEHHSLKSGAAQDSVPTKMDYIFYDSRDIQADMLFFRKGAGFRPTYLSMAKGNGATCYVAEQPFPEGKNIHALVIRDATRAMALLSAAFCRSPQDDLFLIAFTDAKGKTTSAYFLKEIFDKMNSGKTALFSSVNDAVGPKPKDTFGSSLTTPESSDLFRNTREAVDDGMTHLIMEVSSQAHKRNRISGLTYDLDFFLSITSDHIGSNGHPNFTDYLYCRLQLLINSRRYIINTETDYFPEVYVAAITITNPDGIYLFSRQGYENPDLKVPVNFLFKSEETDLIKTKFQLFCTSDKTKHLATEGEYTLDIIGNFNETNGTAATIGAGLGGVSHGHASEDIRHVTISGRMETEKTKNHGLVVVGHAHNKASMMALVGSVKRESSNPKIIVAVGAPGNKGVSRRSGFSQSLGVFADKTFLATDDPGFRDPMDVAEEIDAGIDHAKVDVTVELDHEKTIREAISMAGENDVVLICGKEADSFQKIRGVNAPYPSDIVVARNAIEELEK